MLRTQAAAKPAVTEYNVPSQLSNAVSDSGSRRGPASGLSLGQERQLTLDPKRVRVLDDSGNLNWDRVARLTHKLLVAPVVLLRLLDTDWLWCAGQPGVRVSGRAEPALSALGSDDVVVLRADVGDVMPAVAGHAPRFCAVAPIRNPEGLRVGVLAVLDPNDRVWLSEHSESLRDLAALVEREFDLSIFHELAQASEEVFWITDTRPHRVLYVSPAYERIWQRSAESILKNPWDWIEAIHPEDREAAQSAFQAVLEGEESYQVEFRIMLPDGGVRHILDRGFPVKDPHGNVIRMAGVAADISELNRAREELRTMADTDPLTEALNFRGFRRLLRHELARSARDRKPLAVALLDIDNFKAVNDEHGHLAGDAVLVQVVRALKGRLRASDIVARLGGDEFCVVLPNAEEDSAVFVLSELSREISRFTVPLGSGIGVQVTLSVGIAVSSRVIDEADLLKRADEALYQSKREGRNRVSVAPEPQPGALVL